MINERLSNCRTILADALELPDLSFDEEGHAVITIDGGYLHIQMIDEEDAQILVLIADLGNIAAARLEIQQAMLVGNLSWRDVAGGALALDPEGDQALLVVRLDLATLDDSALAQRLYATIATAERWAAELAALATQSLTDNANAESPFLLTPSAFV